MRDDGLDVVITSAHHDLEELRQLATTGLASAQSTSRDLDKLAERMAALSGGTLSAATPAPIASRAIEPPTGGAVSRSWPELQSEAERRLRARGVDPAQVDLNDLLDPAEAARIERRATGGVDLRVRMDRYDVLFAVAAGVAATVVDGLAVPRRAHDARRLLRRREVDDLGPQLRGAHGARHQER